MYITSFNLQYKWSEVVRVVSKTVRPITIHSPLLPVQSVPQTVSQSFAGSGPGVQEGWVQLPTMASILRVGDLLTLECGSTGEVTEGFLRILNSCLKPEIVPLDEISIVQVQRDNQTVYSAPESGGGA